MNMKHKHRALIAASLAFQKAVAVCKVEYDEQPTPAGKRELENVLSAGLDLLAVFKANFNATLERKQDAESAFESNKITFGEYEGWQDASHQATIIYKDLRDFLNQFKEA